MTGYGRFLILSLIQGLTEFLPVSSSGHLILLSHILRLKENQLAWAIALHSGTFLSVIVYFRKDLSKILFSLLPFKKIEREERRQYSKLFYLIFLGTIPAGIAGVFFYNRFTVLFQKIPVVTLALLLNGGWLFLSEKLSVRKPMKADLKALNWKQALLIGFSQVFGLIPGISRSGATIGCGYLCGLKKELAFNFAFLLSIPATFGAIILAWGKTNCPFSLLVPLILCTALIGYLALAVLSQVVKKGSLIYFAFYCWAISLLAYFYL